MFFFFFFQAEDGIRYIGVTGVQTCALPISCGIFPMAESADDPALYWIEPDMRGIIPLEGFHLAARLKRTVRTTSFTVWVNRDFDAVIDGCAEAKPDRARTWINGRIRKIYRSLFEHGHCHTVEVYDGATLVGGL